MAKRSFARDGERKAADQHFHIDQGGHISLVDGRASLTWKVKDRIAEGRVDHRPDPAAGRMESLSIVMIIQNCVWALVIDGCLMLMQ